METGTKKVKLASWPCINIECGLKTDDVQIGHDEDLVIFIIWRCKKCDTENVRYITLDNLIAVTRRERIKLAREKRARTACADMSPEDFANLHVEGMKQ